MAPPKKAHFEGRNGDHIGLKFGQGLAQSRQVRRTREDRKIGVPAKLGRAVKHARLSARQ